MQCGKLQLLLQFRNLRRTQLLVTTDQSPSCLWFQKLLEQVIFDAIVCHLLKNNLLSHKQSGFCPGHSTQDVLLHVTDS